MTGLKQQRQHLEKVIGWAQKIEDELHEIIWHHHYPVHFRPSATGVAMVGLTPKRPQRGRSGFTNLKNVYNNFSELLSKHCIDIPQGRGTPEKALQSYLIMKSKRNHFERWIGPLNEASQSTRTTARLRWVTDEIAVPVGKKRIVCDLLATREVDGGGRLPVVIELKSARDMKRLVQQVTDYAQLVDTHADLYAQFFSVILNEDISFTGPCEKWIVWPQAGENRDPREDELAEKGIRVVGYKRRGWGFKFRVGRASGLPPIKLHLVSKEELRERGEIEPDEYTKGVVCAICRAPLDVFYANYPGAVCNECDARALNVEGDPARHINEFPESIEEAEQNPSALIDFGDDGDNPVFIDGHKCGRRYRFGGWVTMKE